MKQLDLFTVQQFNDYYGIETTHPLVNVIHYEHPQQLQEHLVNYGIYALFLKENKGCQISYGRTKYDFDEMTVTSFAPGQSVHVQPYPGVKYPKWTALVFHPDLIARTSLGKNMSKYEFFSYTSNEALHLSAAEIVIFRDVLNMIEQELTHPIDKHSRHLIVSNIELLLNYCLRFYDRRNKPLSGEKIRATAQRVHLNSSSTSRSAHRGLFCQQMLPLKRLFWRISKGGNRTHCKRHHSYPHD